MPRARNGSPAYAIGIDDDDDDVIEMGPTRVISRHQNLSRSSDRHGRTDSVAQHVFGLVFPTAASFHSHASAAASRSGHPSRRSIQNPPQQLASRSSRPNPQHDDSTPVIDLTEVPDSPPEQEPQILNGRNPRRTNSQRISPPRLSRSDSTSVGQDASVIDLTADSPEAARTSNVDGLRNRPRRQPPLPPQRLPDELIQFDIYSGTPPQLATRLTNLFGFIGGRHVSLTRNYEPVRPPSPKPPMEPVPPTRDGFTRETCANPDKDLAVICPCCNDELAYDPNDSATSTTTGSRKRKRAPGDHHFWALRKCGHVYCAECFENRRPSKSSPMGAGFRIPPGKSSTPNPNDIRCVVEGCESKAAPKTEWVGIFL